MRVSILTPSVSRLAGGFYESVRQLAIEIHKKHINTEVYSVADEYSEIDQKSWSPIKPHVFKISGFKKFGYSRDLIGSIRKGKPYPYINTACGCIRALLALVCKRKCKNNRLSSWYA